MTTLGDRIKDAADEVGGLLELAALVPVARRTLGDWVAGTSEPKSTVAARIAALTGVSIKWLVLGEGPKREGAAALVGRTQGRASGTSDMATIELSTFEEIGRRVRKIHHQAKAKLPAEALAVAIAERYNEFMHQAPDLNDPEEVELRLRLLEKSIERDLQTAKAQPGTGKHEAS